MNPRDPREGRRSLLSSGLMTYGTQLAAAALSLLNVLVVARVLGPTGRGDVALLTTIAFLTTQAASMGVDQANVNLAGREPALRRTLATNSILLALVLGTLAISVVALLVALVPDAGGDVEPALRWLILAIVPLLIASFFFVHLAEAAYGFAAINAAYILAPIVNVTANGALALAGVLSVTTAIVAWIAGQILGLVVITAFVVRRLGGFGRPDLALARSQVGFGVKAQGGRIMLLGNYRLDQWVLGGVSGSRELGLYSVAVSWTEAMFFLPQALTRVQRPDLVRVDRNAAAKDAGAVFRTAMLLTAVFAVGLIALAPLLCVTVFGEEFRGSVDDLRLLTLGGFGIGAMKMLGSALTAQRRPLLETASIGVAFGAIVLLDILLIPAHGGNGAALASTVAYSLGGIAILLAFCRGLGARPKDLMPRPSDAVWLFKRVRGALADRSAV